MLRIVLLLLVAFLLKAQSSATLTQPSLIQTNTYTLRKTSKNITSSTATLTYMQNYTENPQIFISLVNMQSFTPSSLVSFSVTIDTITLTSFILKYTTSCIVLGISCSFSEIVIDYLVFDYFSYSFVMIAKETFLIDPAITLNDHFYKVKYMQQLDNTKNYSLSCMLAGFTNMAITGEPSLQINAYQYNKHQYYLQVKFDNLTLVSFDYIRILIDDTTMQSLITGPSSLSCSIGTIVHVSDPNVIQNNPSPDFLPFAVFFGMSGFAGWDFSLSKLPYIFNNTTPRIDASIGYILFITSTCPANQLYVSSQNLCYGLSSAFYYQATPATLQPCPYSCYQCVGPLTTQCRSCVSGWNRVLSGGRCVCISGFYDPGGPICKNCTQAIAGCKTCSSATNCNTCLSGCTAIGFNPIYCDCPSFIQQNYSYNCPTNYYFDYQINSCACLPQTYYNSVSKLCFPCATGCYICVKNTSFCLSCIDSYTLIDNTCIYFYTNYALLGQRSNYNDPQLRCLRWDQSSGTCTQRCKYYYYQGNCYSKCPLGTFNISFPWLTCQPCAASCDYCYNYTICYQCSSIRYYFNSSILSCSHCSPNCVKCSNSSFCSQCDEYYLLINNSCSLPSIPTPSCDDNCNYCLLSYQCLQCRKPYYLNSSSHMCIACSKGNGLILQADGCKEICGDGMMINDECDDGNQNSGDGCSNNCLVQNGYECRQINGVSKCWSRNVAVDWLIYAVFGVNNLIISFNSAFPLNTALIDLQCGFNCTQIHRQSIKGREEITLAYQQTILQMHLQSNDTYSLLHTGGNLTKSQCKATFNQMQTFTITLNTNPSLFFINYTSSLASVNNGNQLRKITTFLVYFSLAISILSFSPMTSYSCIRFFMLLYITLTEYMQIPINAFSPYTSLQQIFLIPPSYSTKELVLFSSQYYSTILWHLLLIWAATGVWLEVLVPFGVRMARSMEWGLMVKAGTLMGEHRYVAYQSAYISCEVVVWWIILKVLSNADQATSILIFLVTLQLILLAASKVHFFFTYSYLNKLYPEFTHTMIIQQLQNLTLALVFLATTSKSSYTPFIMILFSICSLLALGRNSPESSSERCFKTSIKMTIWQMRIGYCLFIIVQAVKLAFMWLGNVMDSREDYEIVGIGLGICMGLVVSAMIILGTANSFIIHIIRLFQLKNQGKTTIPSNESIDSHTVDGSSHAD